MSHRLSSSDRSTSGGNLRVQQATREKPKTTKKPESLT